MKHDFESHLEREIPKIKAMNKQVLSTGLRFRLEQIPEIREEKTLYIKPKAVWFMAASILLLVSINVFSYQKSAQNSTNQSQLANYFDYLKMV